MRNEVIWAIRDDHTLTEHEKMFLIIVESRGAEGMYTTYARAANDMGMSKDTYYRARKAVMTKELIRIVRRYDDTTVYMVNAEALADSGDSHSAKDCSHSANSELHMTETKKNKKINTKKNKEEQTTTPTASAAAVVVDLESPLIVKEEQDDQPRYEVDEETTVEEDATLMNTTVVTSRTRDESTSDLYIGNDLEIEMVDYLNSRKQLVCWGKDDEAKWDRAFDLAMDGSWRPDLIDAKVRMDKAEKWL